MQNYKIEVTPTWWNVILENGCYSSREEVHLTFRANSKEEAWVFLCAYVDSNYGIKSSDSSYILEYPIIMSDNESKKHVPAGLVEKIVNDDVFYPCLESVDDIDWDSDYDITRVTIEPLRVIYFNKI